MPGLDEVDQPGGRDPSASANCELSTRMGALKGLSSQFAEGEGCVVL